MGNSSARQATRSQTAAVSRILQRGDANVSELEGLPPAEQKIALMKIIASYRQKADQSADPSERAKFNNMARQLEQRLTIIDRLDKQQKAADSLPSGGLKYMCAAEPTDDKNKFRFICKPYDVVDVVPNDVVPNDVVDVVPVTQIAVGEPAPVAPTVPEVSTAREYYGNPYY